MPTQKNSFLVTRPAWASFLIAEGYDGKVVPNPWKPHLTAWSFPLEKDLAAVLVDLYASVGQQPPLSVSAAVLAGCGSASGEV